MKLFLKSGFQPLRYFSYALWWHLLQDSANNNTVTLKFTECYHNFFLNSTLKMTFAR